MKKVVSILSAMTVLCALFAGCATNTPDDNSPQNNSTSDTSPADNSTTTNDTKTYRMALIQPQNNLDYFNFITASALKYADANGIELTVWQQNSDQAKGVEFVDMAVEQGYDAVMICDPQGAARAAMEEAQGKIAIIGYDAMAYPDLCNAAISTDNVAMGRMLGEYAVELMKADGKDSFNVIYSYNNTSQSEIDRQAGMAEAFKASGFTINGEEVSSADINLEGGLGLWDDLVIRKAEGELDYAMCANSTNALGCLAASESAGRTDYKVFGIDDEVDQLAALTKENGIYYATVAQNPFEIGVQAIEAAVHAVEGQDDGIVKVDGILVTRDTMQEYMANREKSLEELKDYLAIITAS